MTAFKISVPARTRPGVALTGVLAGLALGMAVPAPVLAAPAPQPSGRLEITVEVVGPTSDPTGEPTAEPSPAPTAVDSPGTTEPPPDAAPTGDGSLPRTGASVLSAIGVGAMLLTVGVILRRAGRRRSSSAA